jgi:hypothetical protein
VNKRVTESIIKSSSDIKEKQMGEIEDKKKSEVKKKRDLDK